MIAALTATPYCFNYDMCVVAVAQVLLVQNVQRPLAARARLIHAIVWLAPVIIIPFGILRVPIARTVCWRSSMSAACRGATPRGGRVSA